MFSYLETEIFSTSFKILGVRERQNNKELAEILK